MRYFSLKRVYTPVTHPSTGIDDTILGTKGFLISIIVKPENPLAIKIKFSLFEMTIASPTGFLTIEINLGTFLS